MAQPPNPTPSPPLSAGGDGDNDESKMSDIEYVSRFPPGYRFRPTDKECIVEYLKKKINNEPLPPNLINTVQLYKHTPDFLSQTYLSTGDGVWYFFTPRQKKHKGTTKRADRTAGDGRWKATTSGEDIFHNGSIVGCRRGLVYMKGKSNGIKTDWLMHEFTVINSNTTQKNTMRLDDWVLCKVYKGRSNAGTRKIDDVVAEESAPQKRIKRFQNHNKEVNRTMAYNDAVQLSAESSARLRFRSFGPTQTFQNRQHENVIRSSGTEAASLANPYNQIRPYSESEAPYGNYGNIYEEANNGGGFNNAAMHQHVRSYHQIPTAASSKVLDVPLPSYPQQMLNFPSESCYRSADHLIGQQAYVQYQFNVEQQQQQQPYPYSYQQRYSCCSSHTASLSPLPHYHQQEPAFEAESENEMESYLVLDDIFR